jgi:hypothetical protein
MFPITCDPNDATGAIGGAGGMTIALNQSVAPGITVKVSGFVSSYLDLPSASTKKGELYALTDTTLYKSNGKKWTYIPGTGPMSEMLALPVTVVNPTGSADNVAINAAIAAAGAAGGGIIELVEGVYSLERPVFSRVSNVYIKGAGIDKTVLQCSSTYNTLPSITGVISFVPDANDIDGYGVFGGLTIDKQTNSKNSNGFESRKFSQTDRLECNNGFFAAIKIKSAGSYSVGPYETWGNGVRGYAVFGCSIDGNTAVLDEATASDQQAYEIYCGTDCFIFNNYGANIGNNGLACGTNANTPRSCENVHFFSNEINGARDLIELSSTYDAVNGNGNLIDIFYHDNIGLKLSKWGIHLNGSSGNLNRPTRIHNIQIFNNIFNSSTHLKCIMYI